MLTYATATLACALAAVTADNRVRQHDHAVTPHTYYADEPQALPDSIVLGDAEPLGCASCQPGCSSCGCASGACGHRPGILTPRYGGHIHTWRSHSTCNLYPRDLYLPEAHGNYYFRPYNFTTVWQQQNIAVQWGADPRNPYSNELFQSVYQEVEARHLPMPEAVQPPAEVPVSPPPPSVDPADPPPVPTTDGEPTVDVKPSQRGSVRFVRTTQSGDGEAR